MTQHPIVAAGVAIAAVAIAIALSNSACSSEPCDDARDKIAACLSQVDTRDRDPSNPGGGCTQGRVDEAREALRKIDGVPCTLEAKDIAERINNAIVRPEDCCEF